MQFGTPRAAVVSLYVTRVWAAAFLVLLLAFSVLSVYLKYNLNAGFKTEETPHSKLFIKVQKTFVFFFFPFLCCSLLIS